MMRTKLYSLVVIATGLLTFLLSWFTRIPDLRLLACIISIGVMAAGLNLFHLSSKLARITADPGNQ